MKKSVGILVLFICLIVCAVLSVKHLINYRSLKTDSDSKIYALAGEVTSQGADKLKEHFLAVKENLDKSLVMINDFDKTGIFNSLKKIMETSENISALGFIEISEFNKAGSANILTKKKIEEFVPIEANSSEYGWIKSAIEKTGSVSKPYFDKNINSISLSVSVSKPLSTGKKIILFALITNKDINEIIQNLDFGRRGYGFVTDAEGNVFLHPRDSFQFRKFTDIVKGKYEPENFNKVESAFSLKQPVLIDEKDFNSFSRKIITIQPIPEIECFIGAILNKAELGFAFSETKNILMKLSVASAFSIFFLCMLISAVTFNPESSFKAFRICSAASAAIFFIVIGCVWMLERIYGLPAPETDKGYISDRASLVKFLDDEKKINISNRITEYSYIPVGILVQAIKLIGVNEAQVSGIVWQKIPRELTGKINEGVNFPEAAVIRSEEIYRISDADKNLIVGWTFTATLRQQFDNRLFPFEQLNLKVQMRQKNVLNRIQFIPDLKSYDEYSSFSNSFVSKDLTLPEWKVKQTYFTVQKNEYMTTFGHFNSDIKSNIRDLTLNISLQRDFLSNFFATFLPFLVLLLLAFIGLIFSSGIEEKSKVYSFKASNMQGIASGFILFLVFSIVSIRKQAVSNSLLYIEYLYFFTFIVLLTLVLSVVHIYAQKKSLLGDKDGLYVKVLYWPIILGVILLITYLNFID